MNRVRAIPTVTVFAVLTSVVLLLSGHSQVSADPAARPPLAPTPTPVVPALKLLQLDPVLPAADADGRAHAGDPEISASAIRVTTHYTASADAEILQGYATANCGDQDAWQIRAGYDTYQDPDGRILRSLILFSLADIPPSSTVENATLDLYVTGSYDSPGRLMSATPYRVTEPWNEYAVTWNTQPAHAESYGSDSILDRYGMWAHFDVTALVQGWVDGSIANRGLVVRGREGSPGWRAFGSRTAAVSVGGKARWVGPRLALTYSYEPDYRLLLVPQQHALRSGESASSALYVDPIGLFDDDATLTVAGLPPGAAATLDRSTVSPLDGTSLRITTAASTPGGTFPFTVRGQAGGKARTVQGVLQILQPGFELGVSPVSKTMGRPDEATFTVYLTSTEGFDEAVTLSLGGLPSQAAHAWSQNPATPTASVQLTITTGAATPIGDYSCSITGTAGSLAQSVPLQLAVSDPTFELALSPARQSVAPGGHAQYEVTASQVGAFEGAVALEVGGLPAGATPEWSQNPVTPTATSLLTIQTAPDTAVGEHTFVVTGTHADQTSVVSGTLEVGRHTLYLPLVYSGYGSGDGTRQDANLGPSQAVDRIALLISVARYRETGTISASDALNKEKDENLPTTVADSMGFGNAIVGDEVQRQAAELRAAGFAPQNVQTLVDSQATKGAIHDAIVNWIDPLEDENTLVVLFYSGHGMQVPDDDGDENDAYDECLVPFGINVTVQPTPLQRAIRDDELAAWLDELESQHVVVIADTCFSGGLTPNAELGRVKTLSAYLNPPPALPAPAENDGFVQDIQQNGRLVLMAAAENQYSLESIGLGHGVFTYYLLEALRTPGADANGNGWISAEEAFTYLRPKVIAYTSSQQTPRVIDGLAGQADLVRVRTPPASCPNW